MRILFGWETGMGMGHLLPHRHLFELLLARGHELHVAASFLDAAVIALEGLDVTLWQSPQVRPPEKSLVPTPTIAEVLHNSGFNDVDAIHTRARAWDSIIGVVRPDVAMGDYAATLQLALRGTGIPLIELCSGFFAPPDENPIPPFPLAPQVASVASGPVVDRINACLQRRGRPRIGGLNELFHGPDFLTILRSYPELDPFPSRPGRNYAGCSLAPDQGDHPEWPNAEGPRIFAYLKGHDTLPRVLDQLARLKASTLIVADRVTEESCRQLSRPNVRLTSRHVSLRAVNREANVAITNGNHGTTTQFLLAGVPVLCLPKTLENAVNAEGARRTGAALITDPRNAHGIVAGVSRLLSEPEFRGAARRFGAKYAHLPPEGAAERTLEFIRPLIAL